MHTQFTPYEIQECLFDRRRTFRFLSAIAETVRRGDVAVDAGSGSGVLGLFAARSGAGKVFCIESDPRFVEIIRRNAALNGFSNRIHVIHGDASRVTLPCKVDVIISELLSTGLFYEPEVQVINHLRKFLRKGGRIIPQACQSWVQLVDAQRDIYGLLFNYDSRYENLKNDRAMSNKIAFDKPDFYVNEPLEISKRVVVIATRSGVANAVRITSKAQLSDNVSVSRSKFLFNPLVIFLKDKVKLTKNRHYEVYIRYKRSGDTLGTRISVREFGYAARNGLRG